MAGITLRLLALLSLLPLAEAADYSGSQACKTCHADIAWKFFRNPHFRDEESLPHPGSAGCESCHGPGSGHIKAPSKTSIFAFSARSTEEIVTRCLSCHAKELGRMNFRRSEHFKASLNCTSCHSIHKSPTPRRLLVKVQRELCYSCHPSVRAQFSMPFKHRVNEGVMACTDCHNPHGTFAPSWKMGDRPRLVVQASVNEEACLGCHKDLRGPFVFEHTAVRVEGCETCHLPHGSANPRLLKRPVVFTLCLECHNGTGSGRTGGGDPLTPSFHNMANPQFQNCTVCHARLHGSNSSAFFLR